MTAKIDTRNLVRLTVAPDQDAENPLEYDGWRVVSFSRRHQNFGSPEKYFGETEDGERYPLIGLRSKLRAGTAFLLSYYEHGSCVWSLRGEGPRCRWDSVDVAGVLLWEGDIRNLGPRDYSGREKDARTVLEAYTDWCNGMAMWYSIGDAEGDKSFAGCGGIFGTDSLAELLVEDLSAHALEVGCVDVDFIDPRDTDEEAREAAAASPSVIHVITEGEWGSTAWTESPAIRRAFRAALNQARERAA